MGQHTSRQLRHAKRDKEVENGVGAAPDIRFGSSSCQGYRESMEDAHCCKVGLPGGAHLFGVFDGHGGHAVAVQAARILPKHIERITSKLGTLAAAEVAAEVKTVFLAVDQEIAAYFKEQERQRKPEQHHRHRHNHHHHHQPELADSDSGSTCCAVLVTQNKLIFMNLGDSRGFVSSAGRVRFATKDHKPSHPAEEARVKKAGGNVSDGRVCGMLAVARAFGDAPFKETEGLPPDEQMIVAVPEVTVLARETGDEFVFIGCDGVYDVMTTDSVASYVRNALLEREHLSDVCSMVLDESLDRGSTDNLSSILVCFAGATRREQVSGMIDDWFDGMDDTGAAETPTSTSAASTSTTPDRRRTSIKLQVQDDSYV